METCQAGSDNSQKEGEKVSLMMFVVEMGRDQSLGLTKRVVVSSRAAYVTKELYGEHDETTQEECVICLSDPKDTALLPCRHLCVCSSCFSRLELCPVCRAPFTAYLRIPTKSEDQDEGEEVLLEGGITGRRSASGTVAIDLENAGSGQDRHGMEAEEGPVTVRATAYGGGESA